MSTDGDAVEVEDGPAPMARANGDAPTHKDAGSVVGGSGAEVSRVSASQEPPETSTVPGAEVDQASEPLDGPAAEASALATQDGATQSAEPAALDEPDSETGYAADEADVSDEDAAEALELDELDEPVMFDDLETEFSETDPDLDPMLAPLEMTQMLFVEVALMLPATHPVVVLQEADSPFRELRIPVGGAEGIAIAYAARGIETPRPLTHELFTRVLEEFTMTLDVVRITDVSGTSFTAEIVVSGPLGSSTIDCRPSDAIALALRQRMSVPIVASPIVLTIAGTDPLGAN